jgi:hypothetical protein
MGGHRVNGPAPDTEVSAPCRLNLSKASIWPTWSNGSRICCNGSTSHSSRAEQGERDLINAAYRQGVQDERKARTGRDPKVENDR